MNIYSKVLAITLSILVCASASANKVANTQSQKPKIRNWAAVQGWTTAKWDGNDKSYQQMRATIDNAIAGGQKPQDLVELYKLPALEHPNDPKFQFRWAYAAYIEAIKTDYIHGENILGEPRKALILAPFPHSREYARLIFLTIGYLDMPFGSQMQAVSKRMVLSFPSDRDVKYAAAKNLIYSGAPSDRNLGLIYIKELIKIEPQRASPHALLGSIYYERWQSNKSKEDGIQAVACYQQYLDLMPAVDSFRLRAQEIIAEIQKG